MIPTVLTTPAEKPWFLPLRQQFERNELSPAAIEAAEAAHPELSEGGAAAAVRQAEAEHGQTHIPGDKLVDFNIERWDIDRAIPYH